METNGAKEHIIEEFFNIPGSTDTEKTKKKERVMEERVIETEKIYQQTFGQSSAFCPYQATGEIESGSVEQSSLRHPTLLPGGGGPIYNTLELQTHPTETNQILFDSKLINNINDLVTSQQKEHYESIVIKLDSMTRTINQVHETQANIWQYLTQQNSTYHHTFQGDFPPQTEIMKRVQSSITQCQNHCEQMVNACAEEKTKMREDLGTHIESFKKACQKFIEDKLKDNAKQVQNRIETHFTNIQAEIKQIIHDELQTNIKYIVKDAVKHYQLSNNRRNDNNGGSEQAPTKVRRLYNENEQGYALSISPSVIGGDGNLVTTPMVIGPIRQPLSKDSQSTPPPPQPSNKMSSIPNIEGIMANESLLMTPQLSTNSNTQFYSDGIETPIVSRISGNMEMGHFSRDASGSHSGNIFSPQGSYNYGATPLQMN